MWAIQIFLAIPTKMILSGDSLELDETIVGSDPLEECRLAAFFQHKSNADLLANPAFALKENEDIQMINRVYIQRHNITAPRTRKKTPQELEPPMHAQNLFAMQPLCHHVIHLLPLDFLCHSVLNC